MQPKSLFSPEMATIPVIKCTSKEELAAMRLTDEKNDEKSDKKLTVLESHGYILGKTIGFGSYATVKVIIHFIFFSSSSLFHAILFFFNSMCYIHARTDREVQSTQLPSSSEDSLKVPGTR